MTDINNLVKLNPPTFSPGISVSEEYLQVTILNKVQPDEFYNLAAQSHVHVRKRISEFSASHLLKVLMLVSQTSFELPVYTAQVDAVGTLNALEAVRQAGLAGKTKFYQVRIRFADLTVKSACSVALMSFI